MKRFWTFIVAAMLVLFDQATKLAVKGFSLFGIEHHGMQLGQSFRLLGETVRITFVENPGMAFGIEFGAAKIFLSLFSLTAAGAIAFLLWRMQQHKVAWYVQLAFALILGGAAGNLIDRIFYGVLYGDAPLFYGRVVDFLDVDIPDVRIGTFVLERWWVFNIADAAVSCGLILLLIVGHHMPPLHSLLRQPSATVPSNDTQSVSEISTQTFSAFPDREGTG
ncbi:MAG: signal peptidase II [Bacteroidota bacterium]|nr:signal peptidase II [Candidatus Kapabacteria bacterium]MCX7936665.1 signal peptidase II [Chlorobiota bacterium]MDW8075395.1 signal peptidase II [Bacteroidota bacterium]